MTEYAEALHRLNRRAVSDPADTLMYGARKQLLQDLSQILDGPAPITTLQEIYAAPAYSALRNEQGQVWMQIAPGIWQRTGKAGKYYPEFVAQDLPLQPLKERP